jgi:hypothetical protein
MTLLKVNIINGQRRSKKKLDINIIKTTKNEEYPRVILKDNNLQKKYNIRIAKYRMGRRR